MDLQKLLAPKVVAIVGASEKEGFGGDTCTNVMAYADTDKVYFINPKRDAVFGKKCWPSIDSLPENIDLVVLCTPQKTVETLLREAEAKGAKAAVVYASGYSEVGTEEGLEADRSLKELCKELDIALMGPNCGGFMNYIDKVSAFAFITSKRDRTGAIGIISQSGQLCLSFMDTPDMCFSYSISAGNCAVVSMEDYLQYLVDDENTKVIGLYLEGATQPAKFLAALKSAAIKRKPVVILKAGRSEKGSRVAASHTGSLSGADRIYDALFKKFGVIRVRDVEELRATTQLFATLPSLPKQTGFASLCFSGGETGVCADMGDIENIDYPDFQPETLATLRTLLPSYASPANPLDTTASIVYDADVYAATIRAVMDDPSIGTVILGYTLWPEIADPTIRYMAEGMKKLMAQGPCKPMVMLPFLESSRNLEYLEIFAKAGIPILPPPIYAFTVLRYLREFISYKPEEHTLELAIPTNEPSINTRTLSEYDSSAILREYGIRTPNGSIATTAAEATKFSDSIGYPVVMKIASADIPHKSDIGGVELNLKSAKEVEEAFTRIMKNAKDHAPKAQVDGIFIQEMLKPGLEVIIGVNNDPQFGPAVLVGLGGIFVEIFRDTALLPAPFGKAEALRMLESLKALPLFMGYRGKAHLDLDALADMVANVARLATDHRDTIIELDINPVFVYEKGQGVCAADALVVMAR